MPNFVQVGQAVPEIWPFVDFSRWRSSAILDFQNLEILTADTPRRANMCHPAKFCADRSNRGGDMAVFRHLGFFIGWFGPPLKCILVVSVTVQNLV